VGPLSPEEAKAAGFRCPVCRRRLTKGVEDRIEELSDRPRGFTPPSAIPYMSLLPLQELLATALGLDPGSEQRLYSANVWDEYRKLVTTFGDEFKVLIEAPPGQLVKTTLPKAAELIVKQRKSGLRIIPGYDGVYGRLAEDRPEQAGKQATERPESGLAHFMR